MLEKKNTSLAKPLRVSSQCIPLFLEFSGTVFSLDRHIFPATSLSLLQHIYCSCTWMNVLQGADIAYGLYCVSRHISQCGPVCVGTAPTLFPHCSLPAGHSSEQLSVLLLLCCCSCSFAKAVKRFEMEGERGACEITCSVVGERSHAARCVVVWLCCFTMPSKQEHCVTVGGFHCNNQTHWITLCTLHTPFGNGAFTPIDTLPFAATTNKISVWVESCWVCISCLPFCEFS